LLPHGTYFIRQFLVFIIIIIIIIIIVVVIIINPITASDSILQISPIEINSRIILLELKCTKFITASISHRAGNLNWENTCDTADVAHVYRCYSCNLPGGSTTLIKENSFVVSCVGTVI
jgi:hypothetical protein